MAVKFSEFTQKTTAVVGNLTEIVGFGPGELNIRIVPSALDTTYAYTTTNGASPVLTLTGTKPGFVIPDTVVTLTGSSGAALLGSGTNAIDIASTAYALTSTDTSPAGTVPLVLTGTGGGDAGTDTVNLVGTGTVQVTSSANTITIDGGAAGGVTSFTNANGGTYVAYGTVNTAATGPVTIGNVDLTAVDGTSDSTTRFLSKDNTWDVPSYSSGFSNWIVTDGSNNSTVSSGQSVTFTGGTGITSTQNSRIVTIAADIYGGAANVGIVPAGGVAGQYLDGAAGAWTTLPAGDTYTLQAGAKSGTSVPIQLDAAAGADSTVSLTEGTGITLTQNSATEITIASAAGISRLVTTDTGDGTTLIFTNITGSLTLPASNPEFNIDIYISGVYQAKASYTYTTATNGTITFASGGAPPNGAAIEYVTTT